MILIEEAWKAIAREGMAEYIKYLFKTVRKFFGEAIVVTQEVEDIISSPLSNRPSSTTPIVRYCSTSPNTRTSLVRSRNCWGSQKKKKRWSYPSIRPMTPQKNIRRFLFLSAALYQGSTALKSLWKNTSRIRPRKPKK